MAHDTWLLKSVEAIYHGVFEPPSLGGDGGMKAVVVIDPGILIVEYKGNAMATFPVGAEAKGAERGSSDVNGIKVSATQQAVSSPTIGLLAASLNAPKTWHSCPAQRQTTHAMDGEAIRERLGLPSADIF